MTVSLWIRETAANGKRRRYVKPNKKRIYPEGTVFCLRYAANGKRRWETLDVNNLNAALSGESNQRSGTAIRSSHPRSRTHEAGQSGRRHVVLPRHGFRDEGAQDVVGIQLNPE